jgi:hypothetical protein
MELVWCLLYLVIDHGVSAFNVVVDPWSVRSGSYEIVLKELGRT